MSTPGESHAVPAQITLIARHNAPVGDLSAIGTSALGFSLRSVDVAAMPDTENDDLAAFLIDSVENTVGTPPSTPDALQLVTERSANSTRVVQQRAGDEVDDSEGNRF